jgi:hypothetical protein
MGLALTVGLASTVAVLALAVWLIHLSPDA